MDYTSYPSVQKQDWPNKSLTQEISADRIRSVIKKPVANKNYTIEDLCNLNIHALDFSKIEEELISQAGYITYPGL